MLDELKFLGGCQCELEIMIVKNEQKQKVLKNATYIAKAMHWSRFLYKVLPEIICKMSCLGSGDRKLSIKSLPRDGLGATMLETLFYLHLRFVS